VCIAEAPLNRNNLCLQLAVLADISIRSSWLRGWTRTYLD